jgi:flagellar hook assembly protein FlgD
MKSVEEKGNCSNCTIKADCFKQLTNRELEFELSEISNISFSNNVSAEEIEMIISKIPFTFLQNSPNPFNPETTISFELTSGHNENIELAIYNLKGQIVKQLVNENLSAGSHSYRWNGRDDNHKPVASGVYFYKLQVDGNQKTKKMLLLK